MNPDVTPAKDIRTFVWPRGLVLLVLSLLIGSLPMVSAYAYQDDSESDSYRTELLDWNISTTGPNYVLSDVALEEYPHGRGERIYITSVDSLGFVEVAFFDDEDTPEQTIDIMLRDFEAASTSFAVLDSGLANDIHYALARFDLGQGTYGYFYIEVAEDIDGNVDLAQSIYTLNTDFLEQLEIAREEISLGGLAFLANPVIDLPTIIADDTAMLESTPAPVATPQRGSFTFETRDAELVVDDPIEYDFPFSNNELEVIFLTSIHGYGVVGFIHQDADSADAVLGSVFVGAPAGSEAPVELFLETEGHRALGVYRVQTQDETRAMVIEVVELDDGLWQVQAMAVTESEFVSEFEGYRRGVTFNGQPFLNDIDLDVIVNILEED